MEILLSPQKNKVLQNVRVIILCAGEGTRINNIVNDIPKSMIRFEIIDNRTILEDLIHKLIDLKIDSIVIITGHLSDKIENHIRFLKKRIKTFKDKLYLINTGTDYKLGPLYSFLTFTKRKDLYESSKIYITIPGDTIFEDELLEIIYKKIALKKALHFPDSYLFYKSIEVKNLKRYYSRVKNYSSKLITVIETRENREEIQLTAILKKELNTLQDNELIKQPLPIFVFTYDYIQEIIKLSSQVPAKTLAEIINMLISRKYTLKAFEVDSKLEFFDVDDEVDFKILDAQKKENGQ